MTHVRIEFDNVWANIVDVKDKEIKFLDKVTDEFKVDAPGAKYIRAHQLYVKTKGKRGWDGKARLISDDERFLSGLLGKIVPRLAEYGVPVDLIDNRSGRMIPSVGEVSVNLRDYQWDALNIGSQNAYANTWWPRGVFKIATGGGKTELAVAMYQYLQVPTLFLVNKKTLVNQAVKRFNSYDIDAGQMGDGVNDYRTHGVTVATIQTLDSFARNGKPLGWLNDVQQVFFDEAHMIAATLTKGNTFVNIASMLPNALMRWGLTATPFMKDQYSNWLLEGVTGNVLYEIKSLDLIKMGYLTPPNIHMVPIPKIPRLPRDWISAYASGIVLNDARNNIIIKQMGKVPTPCFILVNETAHAEILHNKAMDAGYGDIPVLDYRSSTKLREASIARMLKGEIDYVIVTKIFDEGLDVPELKGIILGGGGKSQVKALQRLGRLLRRDSTKETVTLIDLDDSTGVLLKHAKERRKIWNSEGFTISD